MFKKDPVIGIIGLGYVGLPLAVVFSEKFKVVGFDIDPARVEQLGAGVDHTNEVDSEVLENSRRNLMFSSDTNDLKSCNFYVVCVPTPIDKALNPDLSMLESASGLVAGVINPGDYVVYESTVYPGATEEICIPIIEAKTGLKLNKDFYAGYSPERINPGDKTNTVKNITKITSGSTDAAASHIDLVYSSVIQKTFRAKSIRTAEAAKVIENIQRDINIALMNELSILFDKLDLDTFDVLAAASSKWNFLRFQPGLVGGHCIGIDPYYLTHKAKEVGLHPEMILSGRRVNESISKFVVDKTVRELLLRKVDLVKARILILGATFKENCSDVRNSKVADIVDGFNNLGLEVDVYDPIADATEFERSYGQKLINEVSESYSAVLICVAHDLFRTKFEHFIEQNYDNGSYIFDLKNVFGHHSKYDSL